VSRRRDWPSDNVLQIADEEGFVLIRVAVPDELALHFDLDARVELSERLADEPAAPPRCARTLALDPLIEVARRSMIRP
jgi:hypothetical protein